MIFGFEGELTIYALKEASFVDERKNLIQYGNVGTGKTHLATAIGIEACSRDKLSSSSEPLPWLTRLVRCKSKARLTDSSSNWPRRIF